MKTNILSLKWMLFLLPFVFLILVTFNEREEVCYLLGVVYTEVKIIATLLHSPKTGQQNGLLHQNNIVLTLQGGCPVLNRGIPWIEDAIWIVKPLKAHL